MFGGLRGQDALPEILKMIEEGVPVAQRDRPPEEWPEVEYLEAIFRELNLSRQSGMSACPILYQEIEAWQRLTNRWLSPWWVRLIKLIDACFLSAAASAAARK